MITENFILLPGTLTDHRVWMNQVPLFQNYEHVNLRKQNSVAGMLNEILKTKFETFHLLGFSMGGYIAQEFAIKYPERVKTLTIIGSSAVGYPPEEKELVLKTLPLIKPETFKGITEKRLREYLHPHSYQNEEIKHLIKDMAGPDAAEVYLRQLEATLDRRALCTELNAVNKRINFIAGKDDQIVKLDDIQKSHHQISNSRLVAIKECGHFVPLEKPEELNGILKGIYEK